MDMSLSQLQETVKTGKPGMRHSMGSQRAGHDLVTKEQSKRRWGMGIKSEMTKGLGCRAGVRNWKSYTKRRNKTENFQLRFGFPEHDEGALI